MDFFERIVFAEGTTSKPAVQTAGEVPVPARRMQSAAAPLERMRAQPASVRHVEPVRPNDPIAALIAPTPQLIAVQQALADFAYGPVAPTGVYDPQTRAAIARFEKARGLPADGQLSERFLRELSTVAGRRFE
jgi:peptidoglycan hydrolase-like protein with peptidoglycan-binding domain